jgi:hypothetical protein
MPRPAPVTSTRLPTSPAEFVSPAMGLHTAGGGRGASLASLDADGRGD